MRRPRAKNAICGLVAFAVAGVLGGCGGSSSSVVTSRPGLPIPTRFASEQTTTPGITTADGAPRVTQFQAPTKFWCLPDYSNRSQITIGWHVPSATAVSLKFDGRTLSTVALSRLLAPGQPPFEVLAGGPTGIGATIVFPCVPGQRHTIRLRWRAGGSPAAERVVTVSKAT